jgi:hypothetical protein
VNPRQQAVAERLKESTPFYAEHLLRIVNKDNEMVPLLPSAGQLALDAKLEAQRAAGKPMRAIALKARQVGISTWMQGKLIQRATTRPYYNVVTLAHDRETGGLLYRIGRRMYDQLPNDPRLKPALASTRRGREMHFLSDGFPDSTYRVDTAGESEGGRGGTYSGVHGSEVAMWDNMQEKLVALLEGVPRTPESLVVLESTARGDNEFKGRWDDAMDGRGQFLPFFWPWWKEQQYSLPFSNDDEKERFRVGDESQSPYAVGELELFDPGPVDIETNEHVPLTLEQLNWRRAKLADFSGDLNALHSEYPSSPEEAFVASGRKVFDPQLVRKVFVSTSLTDPVTPTAEHPGPARGNLIVTDKTTRPTLSGGTLVVPTQTGWVDSQKLTLGQSANWKLWTEPVAKEEGQYVIGVDVSGGEIEGGPGESAWHAIEIIDHKTREQVAEYRSRVDKDLLAEEIYLACLFFNKPWVAVEITGSWGVPVAERLWTGGFRYPFLHFRKRISKKNSQKTLDTLGFDTNRATKPVLETNTAEMLREGTHGIKSRGLASELETYVRDPNGKSRPESGKFSDRLMAWQIAQQVANEQPIRRFGTQGPRKRNPNDPTGWR